VKPEDAELVRYRLQEARDTLAEAEALAERKMLRGALNRAYYSMFYATLALLATRELVAAKHSGVLALFRREFVRPGTFPVELARHLDLAFSLRNRGDYRDFVEVTPEQVNELLPGARAFVRRVEEAVSALA
jgi:uncharacterized protein (UPF0332 family)